MQSTTVNSQTHKIVCFSVLTALLLGADALQLGEDSPETVGSPGLVVLEFPSLLRLVPNKVQPWRRDRKP